MMGAMGHFPRLFPPKVAASPWRGAAFFVLFHLRGAAVRSGGRAALTVQILILTGQNWNLTCRIVILMGQNGILTGQTRPHLGTNPQFCCDKFPVYRDKLTVFPDKLAVYAGKLRVYAGKLSLNCGKEAPLLREAGMKRAGTSASFNRGRGRGGRSGSAKWMWGAGQKKRVSSCRISDKRRLARRLVPRRNRWLSSHSSPNTSFTIV